MYVAYVWVITLGNSLTDFELKNPNKPATYILQARFKPTSLQRQNTEILKQIFPGKEYRSLSPNFHIHATVSDLYIPTFGLPILLEEICGPILGLYNSLTDTWMLKLGLRAALFPEKEYIKGIFVAVTSRRFQPISPKQYFFIASIYVCLKVPNLEIFSSRVFTQIWFVWVVTRLAKKFKIFMV